MGRKNGLMRRTHCYPALYCILLCMYEVFAVPDTIFFPSSSYHFFFPIQPVASGSLLYVPSTNGLLDEPWPQVSSLLPSLPPPVLGSPRIVFVQRSSLCSSIFTVFFTSYYARFCIFISPTTQENSSKTNKQKLLAVQHCTPAEIRSPGQPQATCCRQTTASHLHVYECDVPGMRDMSMYIHVMPNAQFRVSRATYKSFVTAAAPFFLSYWLVCHPTTQRACQKSRLRTKINARSDVSQ